MTQKLFLRSPKKFLISLKTVSVSQSKSKRKCFWYPVAVVADHDVPQPSFGSRSRSPSGFPPSKRMDEDGCAPIVGRRRFRLGNIRMPVLSRGCLEEGPEGSPEMCPAAHQTFLLRKPTGGIFGSSGPRVGPGSRDSGARGRLDECEKCCGRVVKRFEKTQEVVTDSQRGGAGGSKAPFGGVTSRSSRSTAPEPSSCPGTDELTHLRRQVAQDGRRVEGESQVKQPPIVGTEVQALEVHLQRSEQKWCKAVCDRYGHTGVRLGEALLDALEFDLTQHDDSEEHRTMTDPCHQTRQGEGCPAKTWKRRERHRCRRYSQTCGGEDIGTKDGPSY